MNREYLHTDDFRGLMFNKGDKIKVNDTDYNTIDLHVNRKKNKQRKKMPDILTQRKTFSFPF